MHPFDKVRNGTREKARKALGVMISGYLKPVEATATAAADGNGVLAGRFSQFAVATLAAQLAVAWFGCRIMGCGGLFGVKHGAESLQKLVESARL